MSRTLGLAALALALCTRPVPASPAQDPPAPAPSPSPSQEPAPAPAPASPGEPLPSLEPGPAPALSEPKDPVPSLDPEPTPAPTSGRPQRSLDPEVEPAADDGQNPLPPARENPGAPASRPVPPGLEGEARSQVLPPESLPLGRQSVALTVDVRAPQIINLGQPATLQVVVKNTGTTDASFVEVYDRLPDGVEFLSSVPETSSRTDQILGWRFGQIAAGGQREILVKVRPTRVGTFDHAATVTVQAGGRSRTTVQEPRLKVEVKAHRKVLKGQKVEVKITVMNEGTGPARDVLIQARMSSGLRHPELGSQVELPLVRLDIPAVLPNKRIELEPLLLDAQAAGDQEVIVVASSPDVTPGLPDATSTTPITVIEPKLKLELTGPKDRYTEQRAEYFLTVENTGTATTRNAVLTAVVDRGVKLIQASDDPSYDSATGKLVWRFPLMEPGQKHTVGFQVRTGGIGFCQVAARVTADGITPENRTHTTNVQGIAEIAFDVREQHRVLDVGDKSRFVIRLQNTGTKEAAGVEVKALLSKNLELVDTGGTEGQAHKSEAAEGTWVQFPAIERLGTSSQAGREIAITVRAREAGQATCRVYVTHKEQETPLDRVAFTRVLDGPEIRQR